MSDPFSVLEEKQHEYFGVSLVVETQSGAITVSAIVDMESDNASVHGGSVRACKGTAELSVADAQAISKGDSLTYEGVRYVVLAHPKKRLGDVMRLELGELNASTVPDIRY